MHTLRDYGTTGLHPSQCALRFALEAKIEYYARQYDDIVNVGWITQCFGVNSMKL